MKVCILRSGSSGNCTIIEYQNSYFLLDAGGMSQKRLKELLSEIDIVPEQISALLVTHTHSDHLNYSTLKVCEKFSIPLFIHNNNIPVISKTFGSSLISKLKIESFENDPFILNKTVQITPFDISHDAIKVTSGFSFMDTAGISFTYAADLGHFPDSLIPHFANSKMIVIEANHDPDLLWNNPSRPYFHKKRVAGDNGHLSNLQAADAIIKILDKSDLVPERAVLCHLSKDHNSPELAIDTISSVLDKAGYSIPLSVAKRNEKTEFYSLGLQV